VATEVVRVCERDGKEEGERRGGKSKGLHFNLGKGDK